MSIKNRAESSDSLLSDIKEDSPCYIKILKKIDFFSFIPVPKDEPVSTRRSMCGSTLFIIVFLAYIIWDGVGFLLNNPPISQTSYLPIDDKDHQVPDFGIIFMHGQQLNNASLFSDYMSYSYTQQFKDKTSTLKRPINLDVNRGDIDWISNQTRDIYSVLLSPSKQGYAKGLLYSTNNATYTKITISKCNLNLAKNTCKNQSQLSQFFAGGRLFLFIKNNRRQDQKEDVPFLIYNIFLIPNVYKRVIVSLQYQIIKTQPDYFFNFFQKEETKISIQSVTQQTSDTSYFAKAKNQSALQLLGITFQMSSRILNTRITYETLIDHISKWGASWGVLFAVFALIFLTHNRKKFYNKNPDWDRFKKKNQINGSSYNEQQKDNNNKHQRTQN